MSALGLSIGATNLVSARVGHPPVMRRAVLTLSDNRPPEVGVHDENPAAERQGVVLSGFVERVGDPVPLVAEDGSSHRAEQVLVEALGAMADTVGGGRSVAIAVPAHWGPAVTGALRGALREKPTLAPGGVPAALIPDSVAALTALAAAPGLPPGVIALVDLGGSGTSITLADAGANLAPIGETVRYLEFSGDHIDQAVLNHVLAGVADANDTDPAGTAAVGSLARLREQCRQGKERLSSETATAVAVDLPGFASDVRLTRTELDNLIAAPLTGLLAAVAETLERNGIAPSGLTAVATVGGGAAIPAVTQRFSEQFRVPVITTPHPQVNAAAGAALQADRHLAADAPTGLSPVVGAADAPTGLSPAADAATGIAPTAWAAGAAGVAATESAADGAPSATHRALAWSQDDAQGAEPLPYTGSDYSANVYSGPTDVRPPMDFAPADEPQYAAAEPTLLPWYKRPTILFTAAAAAAVLAIGGLAITLTGNSDVLGPVTETSTTFSFGPSSEPPPTAAAPTTVTVPGSDGQPTTTIVTPPPASPTSTTTTTSPTTTTSSTTTTTTTSTTTTTTTSTTTTTTTTRTATTTTTSPPAPQPEPEPEPEPAPENG